MLTGCQGSGRELASGLAVTDGDAALPVVSAPAPALPTGMPGLSGISEPASGPRIVAAQNNYQHGRNATSVSQLGTSIGIDNLILSSSEDEPAWGLWRWGRFTEDVLPQELAVWASTQLTNEFWLFLSNFDTGSWELMGPLADGSYNHTYTAAERYVSSRGYTYVVLLTAQGNVLDVQSLNIIADHDVTPPESPAGLQYRFLHPTSVTLAWNEIIAQGLYRLQFYSGPAPSFKLSDPGVEFHGQTETFMIEHQVGGLQPETEYSFCMTALDMPGNESAPSNFVVFTTPPERVFEPPGGLTVIDTGSSWVDLAWQAPSEADLLGYHAFTGLDSQFEIDDEGVVHRNHGLIEIPIWRMTDLQAETEYNAGVQAYYGEGASGLSNIVTFTTESSQPPEPYFVIDPPDVQAGVQLAFDPSSTTDGDTPSENLVFKWDFENDGVTDRTTLGPEVVNYVYGDRGPVTARLTVSDGTPVSITQDLLVKLRYDYHLGAEATGYPGIVEAMDACPADETLAVLMDITTGRRVRFFNGAFWQTISAATINDDYFCDIALRPGGVSLLTADYDGTTITWYVLTSDGGAWSLSKSESLAVDAFVTGRLDVAPNGRVIVSIISGQTSGSDLEYSVYAWHEKADGTFDASDAILGINSPLVLDVQRNNDSSYVMYGKDGQLHQWTIQDSASGDVGVQDIPGSPTGLVTGVAPDDPSHLYWAVATDSLRIYYGDNYGEPLTAGMYRDLDLAPTSLIGVGHVGDNGSLFFWTDEDAADLQRLLSYAPFPDGSGEFSVLLSGIGIAAGGAGDYYADGGDEGVYIAVTEVRDGECIGRFIVDNTIEDEETLYAPEGDDEVGTKHQSLILSDGSSLCLAAQSYATARGTFLPYFSGSIQHRNFGINNWVVPDAACPTRYAGEFHTGSYTPDGALELTLFTTNYPTGREKTVLQDTSLARLTYNPFSTDVQICYAVAGGSSLEVRDWGGIVWGEPVVIYSGSATIEALVQVGTMDYRWGVACIDSDDRVWLIESILGVWSPARALSAEPVDAAAGIGLDYNTDGRFCVAVERDGSAPGVYLGVGPMDGNVQWERVAEPGGAAATSLQSFFHLDAPLVLYYQEESNLADSRVYFVEDVNGAWTVSMLPDQMHGSPVGIVRNVYGDVVLGGYRIEGGRRRAVLGVLYR